MKPSSPALDQRAPFSKILVPHDLSERSTIALRVALAFEDASLHLMHALAAPEALASPEGAAWIASIEGATADERARVASALREIAKREGAKAEVHLVIGAPPRAISALARHIGADLIIMTTRPRRSNGKLYLGSTAAQTLRRAVCAVLVIPLVCGATGRGNR